MPAFPPAFDARAERSARRKWVFLIVGLLVFQVVFGGVSVALALRGRGIVVESDYYNKALHWDDHEALVLASAKLGWKSDISVGNTATAGGQRALILTLTDRNGLPVQGANVQVAFFHRATPLDLQQAELKPNAAGTYAALVPLNRPGNWEFRLTIHRSPPPATTPGDPGMAPAAPDELYIATLTKDLLE